jgi:hypothetical protein
MPTITRRWTKVRLPLGGIALCLFIWFAGMAVIAYLFDPAAVIVFAPSNSAPASIIAMADGKLLRSGYGFATGTSDRSGFVRRLYADGAWFVWPSLARGCFSPDRFTR